MAVNVTVRDIKNFPGGTAKTITVDIVQIVPVGGDPEGDEIWVSSSTTAATASGAVAIQSIFNNEMKRGFIRSSGLISGLFDIGASQGFKIAIDEDISAGINITLTVGNNLLADDVASDIEALINATALIGSGGSKAGNLSYLNVQVRHVSGKFQIESGTVSDTFTGTGKSSVVIGAPDTGNDVRATLGLDIIQSSETLATRQIAETSLTVAYSVGDVLTVASTAGISAGDTLVITNGTISQNVVVSGSGVTDDLPSADIRFVTQSGQSMDLSGSYGTGSMVRLLHESDVSDPVSAVITTDQLYRFAIDSMINQIDFSV